MNEVWYNQHVKENSGQDLTLDQALKQIPMNVIRDLSEWVLRTEGALPSWLKETFEYMCNLMWRSRIKKYEKLFARWKREGFLSSSEDVECSVCKGTGDHPRLQHVDCYFCGGRGTVKKYTYVGELK